MKCTICGNDVEEIFLGKFKGTVIRIKSKDSVKQHHVCNECQKEYHGDLKKKVLEMQ